MNRHTSLSLSSALGSSSALLPVLPLFVLLLFVCTSGVSAQQLAVKTNAMYWLTSTPNVAIEAAAGRHLSFQLGVGYNAWKFSGKRSLKHLLITPEVRFWPSRPMERHFLSLHGQYALFNLRNIPFAEGGDLAYRGHLYGGGLSYGYQWALGKRWGLEVSVGGGYLYLSYSKFQATDCCVERISDHKRSYFGPTQAAINLIYIIR